MKIQINGFEIEIVEEDTSLVVKVLDASGKELSNNTYAQEEATGDIQPAQLPSVQNTENEAPAQPVQPVQEPATEESFMPTLESIKKS